MDWLTPEVMWFLIGLILLIAELGVPSLILIFFGVGAWTTTLTTWITGIGTELQLIVFVVTSIGSLLMFRKRFLVLFEKEKKATHFKDVDSDFTGKIATATEKIDDSGGYVLFNGTKWKAISDELIEPETKVKIVSKNNITLKVKHI